MARLAAGGGIGAALHVGAGDPEGEVDGRVAVASHEAETAMPVPPTAEPTRPAVAGRRDVGEGEALRAESVQRVADIAVGERRAGDGRSRLAHRLLDRDRVHRQRRRVDRARTAPSSCRRRARRRRRRSGRRVRRWRRACRDWRRACRTPSANAGRSGSSTLPSPRERHHLVPGLRRARRSGRAARPAPAPPRRSAAPTAGRHRCSSGRTGRRSPLPAPPAPPRGPARRAARGSPPRRSCPTCGWSMTMRS